MPWTGRWRRQIPLGWNRESQNKKGLPDRQPLSFGGKLIVCIAQSALPAMTANLAAYALLTEQRGFTHSLMLNQAPQ